MLHGLVDTIADIWSAPDRWIEAEQAAAAAAARIAAQADEPPPEPEDETFRARFLELARTRQRQNGPVVVGLLHVVWPGPRLMTAGPPRDQRALAGMLGDSVLNQMAAPPDCFAQRNETTYLLCFASGNLAVAELRATMMAQALRAALLRALPDDFASVRVESIVAEIDPVEVVLKYPRLAPGLTDEFQDRLSRRVSTTAAWVSRAA